MPCSRVRDWVIQTVLNQYSAILLCNGLFFVNPVFHKSQPTLLIPDFNCVRFFIGLGLTITLDYSESFLCKSVQLYFSIVIGNKVKCVFENIAICFWTPSLHESTDSSTIHWSILPFLDLRCAALNHRNLLSYRLIFAYCFLWSQAIRVALSSCWCLTSNQSQWLSPFNLPLFAITQLAWMSLQYSSICSFLGLAILYHNAGFPTVE